MTTLPHPASLQVSTHTFKSLVDETVQGLFDSGARTIAIVTGHYAHGHHIELYRAAFRAMFRLEGLRVFAGTPLEPLGDDLLLDHAAESEVSQLLAIRPELVELTRVTDEVDPKTCAVLGDDPRRANAQRGKKLLRDALGAWTEWVRSVSHKSLLKHYETAQEKYKGYVNQYYHGSWELAIAEWWDSK